MSDLFVSDKAEDGKRVRPPGLEALEAEGFTVWWEAQIGGDDEWCRSERELDAANACRSYGASARSARKAPLLRMNFGA